MIAGGEVCAGDGGCAPGSGNAGSADAYRFLDAALDGSNGANGTIEMYGTDGNLEWKYVVGRRRGDGTDNGEVCCGVVYTDSGAGCHMHVECAERNVAMPGEHREEDMESVDVDANASALWRTGVGAYHECLDFDEQRAVAKCDRCGSGADRGGRRAQKCRSRIRTAHEALGSMGKHTHDISGSVSVFRHAEIAEIIVRIALEDCHLVHEMLECFWSRNRPILGDMSDDDRGDVRRFCVGEERVG